MNRGTFSWRLIHLDPAVFRGAVVAVVALLGAVGIRLSPAVPDALIAVWVPLAAMVQAVWTRPAVTANARVVVLAPDPVGNPRVVAAGEAVTLASNVAIIDAARTVPAG